LEFGFNIGLFGWVTRGRVCIKWDFASRYCAACAILPSKAFFIIYFFIYFFICAESTIEVKKKQFKI